MHTHPSPRPGGAQFGLPSTWPRSCYRKTCYAPAPCLPKASRALSVLFLLRFLWQNVKLGRMARRSNQNSIPSSPSIRSKSDSAGPGVRSTVMYGERICARARRRGCIFLTCVSCMGEVSSFCLCSSRFVRVACLSCFFGLSCLTLKLHSLRRKLAPNSICGSKKITKHGGKGRATRTR